jgi:hypothetical protein
MKSDSASSKPTPPLEGDVFGPGDGTRPPRRWHRCCRRSSRLGLLIPDALQEGASSLPAAPSLPGVPQPVTTPLLHTPNAPMTATMIPTVVAAMPPAAAAEADRAAATDTSCTPLTHYDVVSPPMPASDATAPPLSAAAGVHDAAAAATAAPAAGAPIQQSQLPLPPAFPTSPVGDSPPPSAVLPPSDTAKTNPAVTGAAKKKKPIVPGMSLHLQPKLLTLVGADSHHQQQMQPQQQPLPSTIVEVSTKDQGHHPFISPGMPSATTATTAAAPLAGGAYGSDGGLAFPAAGTHAPLRTMSPTHADTGPATAPVQGGDAPSPAAVRAAAAALSFFFDDDDADVGYGSDALEDEDKRPAGGVAGKIVGECRADGGMCFHQAYEYVKQQRSIVNPNFGFQLTLKEFGRVLEGRATEEQQQRYQEAFVGVTRREEQALLRAALASSGRPRGRRVVPGLRRRNGGPRTSGGMGSPRATTATTVTDRTPTTTTVWSSESRDAAYTESDDDDGYGYDEEDDDDVTTSATTNDVGSQSYSTPVSAMPPPRRP